MRAGLVVQGGSLDAKGLADVGGRRRRITVPPRTEGLERALRLACAPTGPGPERFQAAVGPLGSEWRRRLYSEELARAIDRAPPAPLPIPADLGSRHPVEWLQHWDIATRMHDYIVQTLDHHSMARRRDPGVPSSTRVAEWCWLCLLAQAVATGEAGFAASPRRRTARGDLGDGEASPTTASRCAARSRPSRRSCCRRDPEGQVLGSTRIAWLARERSPYAPSVAGLSTFSRSNVG